VRGRAGIWGYPSEELEEGKGVGGVGLRSEGKGKCWIFLFEDCGERNGVGRDGLTSEWKGWILELSA